MPKEGSGNKALVGAAGVLPHTRLFQFLGARDTSTFSATCKAACGMTSDVRKEQALQSLLTAVVEGNEDLARKIVTLQPEVLLDASAIVTDLSGKRIKNLTPLQAAICAGDVDMVQMIIDVLRHKLQVGIPLSFNPELEMQRQIATIYQNGDINAKEAEQIAAAQEFKTSMLRDIFAAINANAAIPALVKFELDNPGQHTDSDLNAALHNFRTQFATTANSEQIFNPFYLLSAFEFYDEQFNNFNGNADSEDQWNRRRLFWRQVIGYIQRHLPACLLQAFAQGIYNITENNKKLNRYFKFAHMRRSGWTLAGDLNDLGYKWVFECSRFGFLSPAVEMALFSKFIANKKIRFGELTRPESQWQQLCSYLPTRCVIA